MAIISVLNLKGGCGKSTVAIHLATAMAKLYNKNTLLIDTDPGGSSQSWHERRSDDLANLAVLEAVSAEDLKRYAPMIADIEMVVIDGSPALEEKATASAAMADIVIVPVIPSPLDIMQLAPCIEHLKRVQAMKPGQKIYFLINHWQPRTNLSKETPDTLARYGLPILASKLGPRLEYREAILSGKTVIDGRNKKAREEIKWLASEIHQILKLK